MPNVRPKEGIEYFPLAPLLKETEVLTLDRALGVLSRLSQSEEGGPLLLGQIQFSESELAVAMPILQSYPHYCPDDLLWVSYNRGGQVTEDLLNRARERLQEAKNAGVWDHEMRPVRNILSRARFKFKELGLGVVSILETGYLLISLEQKPRSSS